MKMWEPLIKHSTSSFTYNKSDNEIVDESTKLLPSRADELAQMNQSVDSTSHLIL